jgi:uncharacterized protein
MIWFGYRRKQALLRLSRPTFQGYAMIRLFVALSLFLASGARAESLKDSVSNIALVGEAAEEIAPDRAVAQFAVVTERPTAAAAAAENAHTVEAILAELKALGVADADVQTHAVSLEPITLEDRDPRGKLKGTVQSFRANNTLTVTIKPVDKAGEVIGKIIEKGANRLDSVDYQVSSASEKRDALRAAAVKDAERHARIYVEAAGAKLGRVLEIRPLEDQSPMPRPLMARAAMAPDAAPVPLRPGPQRVVERVSMVWALSR